jgi:hypothetical protein
MWSPEEIRREGAYHEAAHAVVDILEGHTVRYVSIETEGTNYQDICMTSVETRNYPGAGRIPIPWQALGHAVATIAGNMAMWREGGETYPRDSWEQLIAECEELEALGDPDELDSDTIQIRKYCEAALLGQKAKMPTPDEPAAGAPSVPRLLKTGEE